MCSRVRGVAGLEPNPVQRGVIGIVIVVMVLGGWVLMIVVAIRGEVGS